MTIGVEAESLPVKVNTVPPASVGLEDFSDALVEGVDAADADVPCPVKVDGAMPDVLSSADPINIADSTPVISVEPDSSAEPAEACCEVSPAKAYRFSPTMLKEDCPDVDDVCFVLPLLPIPAKADGTYSSVVTGVCPVLPDLSWLGMTTGVGDGSRPAVKVNTARPALADVDVTSEALRPVLEEGVFPADGPCPAEPDDTEVAKPDGADVPCPVTVASSFLTESL